MNILRKIKKDRTPDLLGSDVERAIGKELIRAKQENEINRLATGLACTELSDIGWCMRQDKTLCDAPEEKRDCKSCLERYFYIRARAKVLTKFKSEEERKP